MPYAMIHLRTAMQVVYALPALHTADFLLGNLAPDAVHVRAGHLPRGTKQSAHLSLSSASYFTLEPQEIAAHQARVLEMLRENRDTAAFSFRLGYGVHVLTDLYWAKWVYKPYIRTYLRDPAPERSVMDAYRADAALADCLLFAKDGEACFAAAESGQDFGLPPWVQPGEATLWRENRLAFLRSAEPEGALRYLPLSMLEEFTTNAAAAVCALLQEGL